MIQRHLGVCAALAALSLLYVTRRTRQRKINNPPSPASLPLLGNLLAMPPGLDHLAYIKLGRDLDSDIIFLELLGNKIVVLNSAEAASDLLEKRSAIYSDRVCPPIMKDPSLFDWGTNPGVIEYNDTWRHNRRMMNSWLNSRAVTQFNDLQERQARALLQRLLNVSERSWSFTDVKNELSFTIASTMLQLAYGYHIQGPNDQFFTDLKEAAHNVTKAIMFTNFYVNLFPALARVPDWFPGTGWKQTIRAWREQKNRAVDSPFEWTRGQVEAGVAEPSILGALFQEHSLTAGLSIQERDNILKQLALGVFAGGTDTTTMVLVNFVAAMVSNPHVQAKAQREIDTVLGPDTLPTMLDRARLPYVNNLILEVLRWRPVVPTAIPHVCMQDDQYRGYDILQGTIVMGNVWAISRDEKTYPDPETFNPDRFLDPNVPPAPAFGWGRRKCPGIHVGEGSLFIVIASLLSTYTFSSKKDGVGRDVNIVLEDASNALILELKPFGFNLKPRSEKHSQLVQNLT